MIMMLAVIRVWLGQQTQLDETSLEAGHDTDPSHVTQVRTCTHLRAERRTLKGCEVLG